MEIINYALWKFVYKNFVEYKMHLSKILTISFIHQVQDSCRIRIHHSARNKESSRSSRKKKSRGWEYGKRSFRKQLGNREEESKYPSCGGFKKKKNVSQPQDTPKRVFQKRICVLIMSLVQTVEQRDAKGMRGKLVTLITVEPSPFSLALFLRISRSSFSSSPLPDALPLLLSLSRSFFFFLFLIRGFV